MNSEFVGTSAYVDVDKLEEALVGAMGQHSAGSPQGEHGVKQISPMVSSMIAEMRTLPEVSVERVLAEIIVGTALQSLFQMMMGQRVMELDQKIASVLAPSAPPVDGGVATGTTILSVDDDLGDVVLEAPQCQVGDGEVCESCQ